MNKSNKFVLSLLFGIVLVSFAFALTTNPQIAQPVSASDGITYHSLPCVYTIVDGVKTEDCNPNVLYNTGAEAIEDIIGQASTSDAFDYINLCNVTTAICDDPQADASEDYVVHTDCGFATASGTYYDNGNGNWTIGKTFTSTCSSVTLNATRITNSTGWNLAGNSFTDATLQADDQITINWTIWVS